MLITFSVKHGVNESLVIGKVDNIPIGMAAVSKNGSPLLLKENDSKALKISVGSSKSLLTIWSIDKFMDVYKTLPSKSTLCFTQTSTE